MTNPVSLNLPTEATCTAIWPTIGATSLGRRVGRWIDISPRWDRLHLVSRLMAGLTIPISLCVFAWQLLPFVCRRYQITNRRVSIEKGYSCVPEKSIRFEDFDSIDIKILPGQTWLRCGDLVFQKEGREVFRLSGVGSPSIRRDAILRIRSALVLVQVVLEKEKTQLAAADS